MVGEELSTTLSLFAGSIEAAVEHSVAFATSEVRVDHRNGSCRLAAGSVQLPATKPASLVGSALL